MFGGDSLAPLLPSLGDRLVSDGELWRLRAASDEIAILEVLSSGPNPRRHRVVEVAAQRGSARFQAQIASTRPVPRLLRRMGVPEQDADWLPLGKARAILRAFIGPATVAGFGYVPQFLDQLLGPGWPAIDLLRVARAAGFGGRPEPARLARHFGLRPPPGRRPGDLLDFSAALLGRLRVGRALDELLALGRPELGPRFAGREIPSQPGVYVMIGAEGEPLYVGKSVDVQRRVASYLGSPIAISRHMHDLLQLTRRIDVIPVSSELEALLLEDRLISAWLPTFNVQRRRGDRRRFVRLSVQEPFPRLTLAAAPTDDGAKYFGPFRHATAAARLRSVLQAVLRLRTCTRQLPPSRKPRPACAKAAAGECLAPCIAGPPPEPYGAEVELAARLLSVEPEEFRRLLRKLLRERQPRAPHKIKRQLQRLSA